MSVADEDVLGHDYHEQGHYDGHDGLDGLDGLDDGDHMPAMGSAHDMHAQLQAAATPLDFQATLETKFASYDSYCNLFHYILNSEGPVDLEVPNVSLRPSAPSVLDLPPACALTPPPVLLGLGCHRRVHLPVQQLLQLPPTRRPEARQPRRDRAAARKPKHMGLLQRPQRPLLAYPALPN